MGHIKNYRLLLEFVPDKEGSVSYSLTFSAWTVTHYSACSITTCEDCDVGLVRLCLSITDLDNDLTML